MDGKQFIHLLSTSVQRLRLKPQIPSFKFKSFLHQFLNSSCVHSLFTFFDPHFLTSEVPVPVNKAHIINMWLKGLAGALLDHNVLVTILSSTSRIPFFSLLMYSGFITRATFHFYMSCTSKQRKPVWSSLFLAGFHFCFSLRSSETDRPSTT